MSIQNICDSITSLISNIEVPTYTIPAALLAAVCVKKPGLSVMEIANNIIARQHEAGAPVGRAADGSQNIMEAMELIRVEEIVKAIKLNSRVQIGIPVGGIQITATGANAGGPVQVTGFNINPVHGDGEIS